MKVTTLQENLQRALACVSRIIPTRSQVPALQNVLLQTHENRIMLVGTSLDTTIVYWMDGKIEQDGAVCVPARVFGEFVATLPPEKVIMEAGEGELRVKSGTFAASLASSPQSEFPPPPPAGKDPTARVATEIFTKALGRALFAAATDEARPILSGIRFSQKKTETMLVATDGYRLSQVSSALALAKDFDAVIPAKALAEVLRLSKEAGGHDHVGFLMTVEGQLVFIVGEAEVFTRRVDGEFPGVEKIIPKTFTTRAVVDVEALVRAVKSAAIFARDNSNIIRLTIDKSGIVVSANTPSVGENKIEVSCSVEGDGGEIAFNSRFLLEYFAAVSADQISFEMTGSLNPGAFRPVGDESFLHIIMPVRVQG